MPVGVWVTLNAKVLMGLGELVSRPEILFSSPIAHGLCQLPLA